MSFISIDDEYPVYFKYDLKYGFYGFIDTAIDVAKASSYQFAVKIIGQVGSYFDQTIRYFNQKSIQSKINQLKRTYSYSDKFTEKDIDWVISLIYSDSWDLISREDQIEVIGKALKHIVEKFHNCICYLLNTSDLLSIGYIMVRTLNYAVEYNKKSIIELYINKLSNNPESFLTAFGSEPIRSAFRKGSLDLIQLYKDKVAESNEPNRFKQLLLSKYMGDRPLDIAFWESGKFHDIVEIYKEVLSKQEWIDHLLSTNEQGDTLLNRALINRANTQIIKIYRDALSEDPEAFKSLILKEDSKGNSPCYIAVAYISLGNPFMVEILSEIIKEEDMTKIAKESSNFILKTFSHVWSLNYNKLITTKIEAESFWVNLASFFIIDTLNSFEVEERYQKVLQKVRDCFVDFVKLFSKKDKFKERLKDKFTKKPNDLNKPLLSCFSINWHAGWHAVSTIVSFDDLFNKIHIIQIDTSNAQTVVSYIADDSEENRDKLIDELGKDSSIKWKEIPYAISGSKKEKIFGNLSRKRQNIGNCAFACQESALLILMALSIAEERKESVDASTVIEEAKPLYKKWKKHARKISWKKVKESKVISSDDESKIEEVLDLDTFRVKPSFRKSTKIRAELLET